MKPWYHKTSLSLFGQNSIVKYEVQVANTHETFALNDVYST